MKTVLLNLQTKRKSLVQKSNGGFTVIELLVAMTIFLIVTASIWGLMEVGRVTRNRSSRRSDIMKNARVAINLIGRDAFNAGLGYNRNGAKVPDGFLATRFGLPPDPDPTRDLLTSIIVGNDIFTNNLASNPALRTDTVAFAFRDLDFNTPTTPPPPGITWTGQVIGLQDVQAQPGNSDSTELITKDANGGVNAKIYDLYLVESDTTQGAIMATNVSGTDRVDADFGDPLGLNQAFNGTGNTGTVLRKCGPGSPGPPPVPDSNCTTYVATLTRFFLVSYKVKPDGTLVRTLFGNNRGAGATQQIVEQPLAYNVENLQFKYVLDDGTVTDNPWRPPLPGNDGTYGTDDDVNYDGEVNRIRQIQVSITVQATESDEQTRSPESITLNAIFSTRNMEYDAG